MPSVARRAGEAAWFLANPDVAGFAADDGTVVLNPRLRLSPRQLRSVLLNEATRIVLRCRRRASPAFFLNLWQRARFADYRSLTPNFAAVPLELGRPISVRIA